MTAVRMTPAQARRLGLTVDTETVSGSRRRQGGGPRQRRDPPSPAKCFDCGERCDGETAQSRHLAATGHRRYQLIVDVGETG